MARILVVEDTEELARAIQYNLELEGHEVEVVHDGATGLETARRSRPDLLILDLMLPTIDGFTVLERLRNDHFTAPVLVLTARGEETDKVRGFRAGADQYLVKPFGLMELIERVRSLLRRWGEGVAAGGQVRIGNIEIDLHARDVRRDGAPVHLSPRAFDLLLALVHRNGAVASRHELMKEVWGHRAAVLSRTVDTHVAELRRMLERDPGNPRLVLTVWKKGYRIARPGQVASTEGAGDAENG